MCPLCPMTPAVELGEGGGVLVGLLGLETHMGWGLALSRPAYESGIGFDALCHAETRFWPSSSVAIFIFRSSGPAFRLTGQNNTHPPFAEYLPDVGNRELQSLQANDDGHAVIRHTQRFPLFSC